MQLSIWVVGQYVEVVKEEDEDRVEGKWQEQATDVRFCPLIHASQASMTSHHTPARSHRDTSSSIRFTNT